LFNGFYFDLELEGCTNLSYEEVHEEEQEQDARSYAGDDMGDMHIDDEDDFLSRRVVLREEQHNEVISFVFLLRL